MAPEFNEIEALKGFIRVLQPIVEPYLAVLKVEDTSGNWVDVVPPQPAIYLSHPSTQSSDHPRIIITYNGDTNAGPVAFEKGLEEITDPNNPPALITVPFSRAYTTWVCTLTCDSGVNDKVLRGERLSAAYILRKIRDRLDWQTTRKAINDEMASSVMSMTEITPTYPLQDTDFHNSSVMSLSFDTVSTVYEIDGGCFDRIEVESMLHRTYDDTSPFTDIRTVGPVP